jgi:predicted nucleic acid-binding protein
MRLVLDNNILFSLINPKSTASYLFSSIKAEFLAPEFIKLELNKHKSECLFKSRLSEHEFEIRQKEIEGGIGFVKISGYEEFLEKAITLLSDFNDVDFLALAVSINASIWSNDPHLKQQSLVKVFTTGDLIKLFLLGRI